MTRKTFAALATAGLIALAGLAVGLRPSAGPAATAAADQAGASVETTVLRRTKYIRSKNNTERAGVGPDDEDRYDDDYAEQSGTSRPTTSASGDGEDDDHGSESKRDDESDHDDEDDDHTQLEKYDDDGEDD